MGESKVSARVAPRKAPAGAVSGGDWSERRCREGRPSRARRELAGRPAAIGGRCARVGDAPARRGWVQVAFAWSAEDRAAAERARELAEREAGAARLRAAAREAWLGGPWALRRRALLEVHRVGARRVPRVVLECWRAAPRFCAVVWSVWLVCGRAQWREARELEAAELGELARELGVSL